MGVGLVRTMKFLVFGISSGYGGTEAVVYSILEDLINHGISFDFVNTFKRPLAHEEWLRSLGCGVLPINLQRRGRYFCFRSEVKGFFRKHRDEYEGLWINIQEPDLVRIAKTAKRNRIKRIIMVAHNAGSPNKSDLFRRISLSISRHCIKRLPVTRIAVSQLAGEVTYGKGASFRVVRSGININRFAYSVEKRLATRMKVNIAAEDANLYLFAGRLEEQKNPLFALEVFRAILSKDLKAHCLFVGDGSFDKTIAAEVKKSRFESRIHQIHNVTDISTYLSAADVLIFPSAYEGMGMVLLEAQCSGLPSFASDGPIPKEAKVTDLVTWIPLSDGPEKWASIILNTPTNEHRSGYGRTLIEQGLDYRTVAQKYLSLLIE